jgi:23S rRNA pseudouridine1911/1915/1917 synthase
MLEALPETGRTHQIRIHLSRMGTPVLGDIRYGPQRITNPLFREIPRQMLHARSLGFTEPRTGDWIKVQAPMPRDMEDVLRRLRALS